MSIPETKVVGKDNIPRKEKRGLKSIDEKSIDDLVSSGVRELPSSFIREILKYAKEPGFVSLGGGLPDEGVFPEEEKLKSAMDYLVKNRNNALQYSQTKGVPEYVQLLTQLLREEEGIEVGKDNILTTVGSQLALFMIAKAFIDHGDKIAVGRPSYLGAIQAFRLVGAGFVGIPIEEDGLNIDYLEELLKKGERVKFVYTIPDFQNPAGVVLSKKKREKLIDLAENFNFLIVEDAPYRKLRYKGEEIPTIYKIMSDLVEDGRYKENRVILLNTMSKVLAPGLREGYIVADKKTIDYINKIKQSLVLCNPASTQYSLLGLLRDNEGNYNGFIKENVEKAREIYSKKLSVMLKALEKYMPEGVTWTKPEGGFFVWAKTPISLTKEKAMKLIEEYKVVFVPGTAFDCFKPDDTYRSDLMMRLNFSYPSEKNIEEGIKRLARAIKENM